MNESAEDRIARALFELNQLLRIGLQLWAIANGYSHYLKDELDKLDGALS